ncbi:Eco57I restriction-modification methylase domain-containing protein [Halopelagius longus]|uniref:site-specific DNA-methyltransferase (adenine-specific) n=1 Tax=Halopelagius longus TaxID=1236180 RepID=A0A1H0XP28_9EURY|nr:DNA methyltransferase [Halopelagius longus]RDI71986.1 type II restriction endonuclease subunit M [Halopelagius longus]SDQ04652.1 hypothetical protein SAMN05216278_0057 [Halopelagius longus]
MTLQQITAGDIANWDSLNDIATSFEKRGLKPRPNLGEDHELVLQLADDEFVTIVEAGPGESATDFKPQNRTRHTNFVATNNYEDFTFITRVRSWEGQQHGRIKHQKLSFTKKQFQSESGEKNTILQKLNSIEYGSSAAIYDTLYDTRQVVKEFYQQFETLRTDLVQEVSGIPDDRGDAKQRYVQVILDRMIFLYFIQEKRLLDRNPDYLHEQPVEVVNEGDDRYEEFYAPLFFDYLAEDKQNPDFGKLPYLNGGLFAKNPVEEEFKDAKLGESAKETNELFDEILDFLSDWNWNVDERLDIVDPKNLSPAVLGHIFEQTVNQKEMGAYYTPEEITGFMARRTIHPYLLDQLNETVGANYEEIDDVFGFADPGVSADTAAIADGGMVTHQAPTENVDVGHVETLYHDILKEAKLLDPAVGSGAFLLAGQEVLLDLYMQCIEFFQHLEDEGKGWELSSRTRDELDIIASGKGSASLYAKRTIILNNLYGVDIDEGAVEICKLRLWLSMVADIEDEPGEVEPLPNIDFNIRQGNSLIGFTELMEVNQDGDAPLSNFGGGVGESVREKYEDIIDAVEKHRDADTATEATNWRKEAERRLSAHQNDLDEKVLEGFRDAGVKDITKEDVENHSPFHWVLEFASVYADGGFDVIVGNPPWDVIEPNREDYFTKFDEVFRQRGPSEKDQKQETLLEDPSIAKGWEEYQNSMKTRASYFNNNSQYELQDPEIDGDSVGKKNDLSMLFLERIFDLASDKSYVAQILPGTTFVGSAGKDLRMKLLNETEIRDLAIFQNGGIFADLHGQYKFGVLTFKNSGKTEALKSIHRKGELDVLMDIDSSAVTVPHDVLEKYSPKAKIFPLIESEQQVDILSKYIKHPPLSDDSQGWKMKPYQEINRSSDRDRYVESEEEGDYPVYGGSNIYSYSYTPEFIDGLESPTLWSVDEEHDPEKSAKRRIREKAFRSRDPEMGLKKAIYNEFDGNGSQKGFVNDLLEQERGKPLSLEDIKLDCSEYRIVFRNIAQPTDERTFICAAIPKGIVCHHAINTIRPYTFNINREDLSEFPLHSVYERVFTDRELFVALGLLNSIPFDYLMRRKIERNLVMYKLTESQVPRLTEGDDWFNYIWERAARLNCYGTAFEEMRNRLGGIEPVEDKSKRMDVRAEIDAASFHAYGLTHRDTEFVLDTFHRVSSPRVMTDEYFDTVLEKYDLLKREGPYS